MANTYIPIASTTLSTSAASVTFSSIPQTYTDLVLRVSARATPAGNTIQLGIQFNGNTSAVYSNTILRGNGSTASSTRDTSNFSTRVFNVNADASTANTFSNGEIYIPNYTGSVAKQIGGFGVTETNAATGIVIDTGAGLANITSAITSILLFDNGGSGNFMSGSTFHLYGISNV